MVAVSIRICGCLGFIRSRVVLVALLNLASMLEAVTLCGLLLWNLHNGAPAVG